MVPRHSWNTAKVGVKHQWINQAMVHLITSSSYITVVFFGSVVEKSKFLWSLFSFNNCIVCTILWKYYLFNNHLTKCKVGNPMLNFTSAIFLINFFFFFATRYISVIIG
jgi:hypothetical protein